MLAQKKMLLRNLSSVKTYNQTSITFQRLLSVAQSSQEVALGEEQQKLVDFIVKDGKSVFFTGAAGTGKTVVLREVIRQLKQKYPEPHSVAVTASTGLAGLNIGGRTYQSHLGIGLGVESVSDLVHRIKKSSVKKKRWTNCKVLVIDEISMVDAKMITKLSHIGKYFKKNMQPFGGIQLVFVGDFYQLPPVVDKKFIEFIQPEDLNELEGGSQVSYAFESDEWKKAIDHEVSLTKIYRQASDPTFIKMLNEVRVGEISHETDMEFRKLCAENLYESKSYLSTGDVKGADFLEGSNVYPTRHETNRYNKKRLDAIDSTPVTYDCCKSGTLKGTREFEMINESVIVPDELTLKKGSQVMLVKNQSSSLVNGSLGSVLDFVSLPNYENLDEKGKGNGIFDFLLDMKEEVEDNPNLKRKIALRETQFEDADPKCLPLVKFSNFKKNVIQYKVMSPEYFEYKDPDTNDTLFSKKQLPLILAWALSVHKSQGQTYEKLNCDLSRIFEDGQAYVALSRVVSRDGLRLKSWNREKVQVNPIVKKYYANNVRTVDALVKGNNFKKPDVLEIERNVKSEEAFEDEIEFVSLDDFGKKGESKYKMDEFVSYNLQDSNPITNSGTLRN